MPTLEAQLTALTEDFVARVVDLLRNASFADVAALSTSPGRGPQARPQPAPRVARATPPSRKSSAGGGRQSAARRAELGERVVRTLQGAAQPMGVRALSDELGVTPDLLATPLRELRAAAKISKHGDKRSTTYTAS